MPIFELDLHWLRPIKSIEIEFNCSSQYSKMLIWSLPVQKAHQTKTPGKKCNQKRFTESSIKYTITMKKRKEETKVSVLKATFVTIILYCYR